MRGMVVGEGGRSSGVLLYWEYYTESGVLDNMKKSIYVAAILTTLCAS